MTRGLVTCVVCGEDCEVRWADLTSGDFYCDPECMFEEWKKL